MAREYSNNMKAAHSAEALRRRQTKTDQHARIDADKKRRKQMSSKPRPPRSGAPKNIDNVIALNRKPGSIDVSLLITVLMLVMFGLVMVFSSSYYTALTRESTQNPFFFITKQGAAAAVGLFGMIFMANFDYRALRKWAKLAYMAGNALLILVIFVGEERYGAKRWLDIFGVTFQPSEIAKIGTILYLASYLDRNRQELKTFVGFFKALAIIGLPCFLILIENLSTAIVVFGVGVTMMFIAGANILHFMAMLIPVVPALAAAVLMEDFRYRLTRITTWLDPFADATGKGFQTVQSLYAVASGGFFGLGLGQSRQKLGYIPEAFNDIIFSIVCEELGFFGAAALILLFYALIHKGITIAMRVKDLYGSLVASGIVCMVAIQVIINVAVNTNAIPVTGMALPFISYGGTSLSIMMASMGILLNISRFTRD